MQISKRLSYVLVFAVCFGALVIDRAFLAPHEAAAGDGAGFVVLSNHPALPDDTPAAEVPERDR